jgi:hypothetical protein
MKGSKSASIWFGLMVLNCLLAVQDSSGFGLTVSIFAAAVTGGLFMANFISAMGPASPPATKQPTPQPIPHADQSN